MFGPDLDDREWELRKEGRSLAIGLWCLLLTSRAEDDRQFFYLYADYIDRHAGEDWHCIGASRRVSPTGPNDQGWRVDHGAHHQINAVKKAVSSRKRENHDVKRNVIQTRPRPHY